MLDNYLRLIIKAEDAHGWEIGRNVRTEDTYLKKSRFLKRAEHLYQVKKLIYPQKPDTQFNQRE